MPIVCRPFGVTCDGFPVEEYILTNRGGAHAQIITYGGAVRSLWVPDRHGRLGDVVLGYDSVQDYESRGGCLGALIGRMANRLEAGRFTLNGRAYQLYCNDGPNHLHGGRVGFHQRVWKAEAQGDALALSYRSPDGEEGYPGNLDVTVTYRLTDSCALEIEYRAVSDQDTIVGLTNHSYFNLAGQGSGSVLDHRLRLSCGSFTENSRECMPNGRISPVAGTPLDFTQWRALGERMGEGHIQLQNCGGYDHNFVVDRGGSSLALAAELWEETTGRLMKTYTTKPGIQLYTANFLEEGFYGKGGAFYSSRCAVCLETQYFPNAMAHPDFPSPVLRAGEEYRHKTVYQFQAGGSPWNNGSL